MTKAYVTSIGEPTTDLCIWALQRNGFKVIPIDDKSTLWSKLDRILFEATDDFLRVDADVIVNKHMTPQLLNELSKQKEIWWWQFIVFDWLKLDITHSMSYIRKEALPALNDRIHEFEGDLRPETQLSRIDELYNPRRFATYDKQIMGLHGYKNDLERAKQLKEDRGQLDNYDFEMAELLNEV